MRFLLPLLLLCACTPPVERPSEPTALRLEPASLELPRGRAGTLTAWAAYDDGSEQDVTREAAWSTAASWQATVDAGTVTGLEQGDGSISAAWEGFAASATLTVGPPAVDSLIVVPAEPQIPVGLPVALQAVARTSDGQDLDVTDAVLWSADPLEVATATGGTLVGLQPGAATLRALYADVERLVPVVVTDAVVESVALIGEDGPIPLGFDRALTMLATLTDGSTQDLTAVAQWTSSNPAIATVGPLSGDPAGRVVSVYEGAAIIQAEWSGHAAEQVVEVVGPVPTALLVTATPSEIPRGEGGQASSLATWSDGHTTDETAQTSWLLSPPGVLQVSHEPGREGELTALSEGNAVVIGRWEGFEHSDSVEVTPALPVSLALDPPVVEATLGVGVGVVATASFGDGSTQDVTTLATWTVDDGQVATALPGWVDPVVPGATSLLVSFSGLDATAPVIVDPAALVSLSVSTAPPLAVGEQGSLIASGTWTDGAVTDVTATAFWSSSSPGVATVSNTPGQRGVVTAAGPGVTTILVSMAAQSAAATVTVTEAAPTLLTLAPLLPAVESGQAIALSATVQWTDGAVTDETDATLWSSSAPAIATASNDAGLHGVVTGVAPGETTVTASFGPLTEATAVSVTPSVVGLVIEPDPVVLRSCEPAPLTAVASYAASPDQDVTSGASWSSADGVVSFDPTLPGVAAPVGQGSATITAEFGDTTATTTAWVHPRALRGDWFVAPGGDDGASGSEGEPLATLGAALALAGPGDVVEAAAGSWDEVVVVPDGVTLFAVGGPTATAIGGASSCAAGCARVTLGAGAALVGWSVEGGGDAVVRADGPAQILGCVVLPGASADAGIAAGPGADLSVQGSTLHGPAAVGITAEPAATVALTDSVVWGFTVFGVDNAAGSWTVEACHLDSLADPSAAGLDVAVGEDPLLEDPAGGNFAPASGSPLVDVGGSLGPDADCSPQDRGALSRP